MLTVKARPALHGPHREPHRPTRTNAYRFALMSVPVQLKLRLEVTVWESHIVPVLGSLAVLIRTWYMSPVPDHWTKAMRVFTVSPFAGEVIVGAAGTLQPRS